MSSITVARIAAPPSNARSLLAVVRRGLRDHRRTPLTWGGSLGLMGALMAAVWPSIEGSMSKLMDSYPEGLKQAFGIETLNSVEKYVDAEMLSLIVPLTVAYLAVSCITRATVGAEERGDLDTLLSLPLSRHVMIAGTVIVTAVVVAVTLAVAWCLTLAGGVIAGTGISAAIVGRGYANVWPLAMAFAGLTVLAAGVVRRPAAVTAIAMGTLLGMYVIDLVGKLTPDLGSIRVVSAFRYYGSAIQDGLDLSHVAVLSAAAVLLSVAGAVLFARRDVR